MSEMLVGPFLLPPGQWQRRLHSPFRIMLQNVTTGETEWSPSAEHVGAPIVSLLGSEPFPLRAHRAVVVDEDGWIVFGYSTDPAFISKMGHPSWMGSELGFSVIESTGLIEPVELAFMESIARQCSDSDEWWR